MSQWSGPCSIPTFSRHLEIHQKERRHEKWPSQKSKAAARGSCLGIAYPPSPTPTSTVAGRRDRESTANTILQFCNFASCRWIATVHPRQHATHAHTQTDNQQTDMAFLADVPDWEDSPLPRLTCAWGLVGGPAAPQSCISEHFPSQLHTHSPSVSAVRLGIAGSHRKATTRLQQHEKTSNRPLSHCAVYT